jgi:lipoprotein-anchoring transpeptidase ErfK/SrfK
MRYLLALLIVAAGGTGTYLVHRELSSGPPIVLPPPKGLGASIGNAAFLPGGWTNSRLISLGARSMDRRATELDVEVRPQRDNFSGSPTKTMRGLKVVSSGTSAKDPSIQVRLGDGTYHWQLRVRDQSGVSRWVVSKQGINVDTHPPTAPQVTSPTDPVETTTYHSSNLQFQWISHDAGSGIAGYSYRLDTSPGGAPKPEIRTADPSVKLTGPNTGTYYFQVIAEDRAGNWSPTSTFPVHLDVTPPGLAHVRFNLFQFDPQFDKLRLTFAVTRSATRVRVGIYAQSDQHVLRLFNLGSLQAGQSGSVAWDGRDASGRMATPGNYEMYVRATDRYGHSSVTGWRDFVVDFRRIVVSLSQQRLVAYNGNHVLLTSLVTTGNRALPTPVGTYHILAKFSPFTFRSPWPKSSQFYYPPSKVQYAMLFQEGGYFIHDAPWRSAFGPGTNAQVGKPGSNYTGTHGCINTPTDVAARLYAWTHVGTVVQVVS